MKVNGMNSDMKFVTLICLLHTSTSMTRYKDLVVNVSPTQNVEAGDSVRLDCSIDWELGKTILHRIRVSWTKLVDGELEVLASYSIKEGVRDKYEPAVEGNIGEGSWSVTLRDIRHNDDGLYICQVWLIIEAVEMLRQLK